ncbi:MAG: thermonuclease family protein [Spirochaetaceae bacterium]
MMMMKQRAVRTRILIPILLLACLVAPGAQIVFEATVVRIIDGDSLELQTGDVVYHARLHGVDTPERGQPWFAEATEELRTLTPVGSRISAEVPDVDPFGRLVVRIFADGREVNLLLLEYGAAWHDTRYDQSDAYAQAQRLARSLRRGLWTEPDPIAPWDWRRGER